MSDIGYLKQLTNQGGSVYSVADMGKIWGIDNENYLRVLISRMVKRKDLVVISRGIYTYKNIWDKWELANKYKARYTLILGQKEVLDGTIIIRDMESGIQEIVDQKKLKSELEKKTRV